MLSILLLIIGLVFVVKGADFLVDGASSLAKKYNIPNIVIGLTIVAFGTSAPELAVSAYSAFTGSSEIAIGNVVGSNIANILLILGITAIINPLKVLKNTVQKEIPFALLSVIVLYFITNDILLDGASIDIISLSDALILLSFMAVFLVYLIHLTKNTSDADEIPIEDLPLWKSSFFIFIGLLGLLGGGKLFVDNAVEIATLLGMSQAVIGITIVAFGTSLPELATSVVAAMKKNSDIAVGNVVGSNIFNVFFVLGISGLVAPLPKGGITNFDITIAIVSALGLLLGSVLLVKNQLGRTEGIIFFTGYIAYIIYQLFAI